MNDSYSQGQDDFLSAMRADGTRVAIFLVNGIRLVGTVQSFDRHIVTLSSTTGTQVVYKHAISTVLPDAEQGRPCSTEGPPPTPPDVAANLSWLSGGDVFRQPNDATSFQLMAGYAEPEAYRKSEPLMLRPLSHRIRAFQMEAVP